MLTPNVQALPDVKVETKAVPRGKLIEFDERRSSGNGGRFLTQNELEKKTWSSTAEAMRGSMPGLEIRRDGARPSQAYVVGGRMQVPGCAMCSRGAPPGPCFSAVVLDGAFVYQGHEGEQPFDINSIPTASISGIEYYSSAASMPAKYNGTRGTCGLVMIWTK